jgi:peptidoglycan/LPS O-acetylase OafA/YrhL
MLRRWPPLLWILVYVASVLILNGGHPSWRPGELLAGLALAAIAFLVSLYLAAGPWPGRARPRTLYWFIGFTAACYVVIAVAAAIFLGGHVALAALAAAVIPLTAVTLWVAVVRSKTGESGGRHQDVAAGDNEDPHPGIGVDEERPLGDTPEAHDEIGPHDFPKGHPGRKAAEHAGR